MEITRHKHVVVVSEDKELVIINMRLAHFVYHSRPSRIVYVHFGDTEDYAKITVKDDIQLEQTLLILLTAMGEV